MLVEGMSQVIDFLPRAVLHVVGDGPLMSDLKKYVVKNNLTENVIFYGRITDELPSYYISSDICIVPSLAEVFGNCALEAMAAGKPLIALEWRESRKHH